VDGSQKCSAPSSTATSIVSPSRTAWRAEAPDERGALVRRELLHRAIVSDVRGQLADLLGDRCARRDREVHQDLRAERFAQLGLTPQPRLAVIGGSAASLSPSGRITRWSSQKFILAA
jgi:hypothetical protein